MNSGILDEAATVVEKTVEDDYAFIKRLEEQGYMKNARRTEKKKSIADDVRKIVSGKKGYRSEGFVQVKEGLDDLVEVQTAIDRRVRIDNTPVLYAGERVMNAVVERVNGRKMRAQTLDELFEAEVQVIDSLSTAVTGALEYSGHVLDAVVEYRDDVVLVKFTDALERYRSTEERAARTSELFNNAEERLRKVKVMDQQYPALYKAHSTLKRELMVIDNEFSKYNQSIVFRSSEMEVLGTQIELVNYGVLLLDRLNNYVADVAEHVDRTRDVYKFFRESYTGMTAIYSAFSELSRCVMMGAREMGEQISRMSEMARTAGGENTVPDVLGRMLTGYKATIFAADSRSRTHFDEKASAIRHGYGAQ